jgi:phosphocarrier protein
VSDDGAVEREFVVSNELGFHARPAGEFVRVASRFSSEVEVSRGGEWVSGQSVLSFSLAAGRDGCGCGGGPGGEAVACSAS